MNTLNKEEPAEAEKTYGFLRDKIKSKMDVAKLLGTFLTGALAVLFAFKDSKIKPSLSADPDPASPLLFLGVAATLVGIVFFFATVIAYDRLLMPLRYWSAGEANNDRMQQLMVKAHQWLFIPAGACSAVGLLLLLFALLGLGACEVVVLTCLVVGVLIAAYFLTREPHFP